MEHYDDDLEDYDKRTSKEPLFNEFKIIIYKYKDELVSSGFEIEKINESILWLHRWIMSISKKYEDASEWKNLAFNQVYNENLFHEKKQALRQSAKDISASANLLNRQIGFFSEFTMLGIAMEDAYKTVEEKLKNSTNPAEKPLKALVTRPNNVGWGYFRNEASAILPLIEVVANEAMSQIKAATRTNGQPPKNFRNTVFTAWHKKIEREFLVTGKKSREISISSWNIYFPETKIINQEIARKILEKENSQT